MSRSIIFIDTALADYQVLLASVRDDDHEVVMLDSSRDGLVQIAEVLQGKSGIDALHILSHGSAGSLQLGSATVSNDTIASYSGVLKTIGSALAPGGDILLYGCNVAQGDAGRIFVRNLGAAAGADVAASTTLTGAADKGGDWALEFRAGHIDAQPLQIEAYPATLPTQTKTVAPGATNVAFGEQGLIWNGTPVYVVVGTAPSGSLWGLGGSQGAYYQNPANGSHTNVADGAINDMDATVNGQIQIDVYLEAFTAPSVAGTYNYNFFLQNADSWDMDSDGQVDAGFVQEAYTFQLIVQDPNHAPTTSGGSVTYAEGASGTVTLSNSNTGSSDSDGDTLTYNPASINYTITSHPEWKGTHQISSTNYTVSDGKGGSTNGTFVINGSYPDNAPTGSTSATGTARVSNALTANIATLYDVDDGGFGVAKTYQWQRLNLTTNTWSDISGATNQNYTLGGSDQNTAVRVKIVYGSPAATIYSAQRFIADADGKTTLTVNGNPPPTIVDPEGDVDVTNNGPTVLSVSGIPNGGTLLTKGTADTDLTAPKGDVTVQNEGSGKTTVSDVPSTKTVTIGNGGENGGPVQVDSNHDDPGYIVVNMEPCPFPSVTVNNTGSGPIKVNNLQDDVSLHVIGTGPSVLGTPAGDVVLDHDGTGPVTINDLTAGKTVTDTGSGNGTITVENPAGDVTTANTGNGTIVVDSVMDGGTVTATGTGPTTVSSPDGDVTVTNTGTGTTTVNGTLDGKTVTTGGTGPLQVNSVLGGGSNITVDMTHSTGDPTNVTVNNTGGGTITVANLQDGETLHVIGTGPCVLGTPAGDVVLDHDGTGPVTINNLTAGKTVTDTGSGGGTVTVENPAGDVTTANTGNGTIVVNSVTDGGTVATTGTGPTTVSSPDGNVTINNTGTGTTTVTGTQNGKTVTTDGTGPVQVNSVLGAGDTITVDMTHSIGNPTNVTVNNTGGGTIAVSNLQDGETLHVIGTGPCVLGTPVGNVVLDNDGTGPVTINDLKAGKIVTDTGSGSGTITVENPAGDVTTANNNIGGGTISVTSVMDGGTVTTTGTGPTTVSSPDGNVTITNTGTGTTTATNVLDGKTVTTTGSGPTTVSSPAGNVTIANTGTGTTTATNILDGKTVTTTGSGPTTVGSPAGNITINNTGTGTTTATNVLDGKTVTTTGTGPTTVATPDGDVTVANTGTGTTTVTGTLNGKTVTTGGTGPVVVNSVLNGANSITVDATANQHVTLDNDGTGTINVTSVAAASTIKSTGSGTGTTTITNPTGSFTVDNTGSSPVKVSGLDDASTLTVTGSGPVTVDAPDGGAVNVLNNGTGTVTLSNLPANALVNCTGSGPQTIDLSSLSSGDTVTIDNDGTGAVHLTNVPAGVTVIFTGTGPATIDSLSGTVTVDNQSTSLVTVADAANGATIKTAGTGPIKIDDDVATGQTVTVDVTNNAHITFDNDGAGTMNVTNVADNGTVTSTGDGKLTVVNPAGDVTLANSGTGTLSASGLIDSKTVTTTGTGPTAVTNPAGDVTVTNSGTGTTTVTGTLNGKTVTTGGTGQIEIVTALANGQKVIVDPTGNNDVQITNSGAGQVDMHGNLALDSNDTQTYTLNGNGTTVMSLTGTLSLGNAPLSLNLAGGYTPATGDVITLISNDGTDAVTGSFNGLSEGGALTVGGHQFRISYAGGDGNDVVLIRNDAPTVSGIPGTPHSVLTHTAAALDNFTIADTDTATLTVTLSPTNGTLGGLTGWTQTGNNWSKTDSIANINAAIAAATFTATAVGAASVGISVADGVGAPTTATYNLNAQSAPPVFGTLSTKVAVFSYPNLNGTDANPGSNNENANLASIVQKVINDGGDYTLDVSIASFADANLAAKLNACSFFFMTDMESQNPSNTTFLPDSAKTIIRDWVNNGGVIMMTGTSGSNDVTFLNSIFNWNLTSQTGTSWSRNDGNAAGTPFEGGPASLNNPSATDSIGKGTVAGFKAIYGTDANAAVATIGYGSGTVIFLGYDYYSSGFAGTGFRDTATQYGADVVNGDYNTNTWVTEMIPRALEYSANLSGDFRINESNGALTATNTLQVSDPDITDTVTVTVTGVSAQQKDGSDSDMASNAGQPSNAALLAMLSVSPTPVVPNDATTGTLTWSFNSGTAGLDYLAAGEKLVLTYTLTATDSNAVTATTTLSLTIVGANTAPVFAGVPGTAQSVTVGTPVHLADFTVADPDTSSLTVTLTPTNGTIGGLTGWTQSGTVWSKTDTAAHLNADLANATFTATAEGSASIGLNVNDGSAAPVTATYNLTATSPVVDNGGSPTNNTPKSPVPPTVEDQVPSLPTPGGGTPVPGDGNGDGIPDSQQGAVTSLPFLNTSTPVSNPSDAVPVFVSLVADSREGVVDTTDGNSALITAIRQQDAPNDLPSIMTMPLGMLTFTADVQQSGITETFSLFVDKSVVANGYWVRGSDGIWHNLATKIETVGDKVRIDFVIADGGLFDADGQADGLVSSTGALGAMPLSIVGAVQTAPSGGFWF